MKKSFFSLLMISLIVISGFLSSPVAAQSQVEQGRFTFADLGLSSDMILRGPYDSRSIRFDLPATWKLLPGAQMEIEVTSFFVGTSSSGESNFLGAILDVSFNDRLQQSIPLVSGQKVVYKVPIAAEDLVSPFDGGWHKLSFFLDAAVDCDLEFHKTTVVIDINSKVIFPYEQTSLQLDLRRLPWPIYLERGKVIDPVTVVLPTSPSVDEMQAGLIVMGAFGRMTSGNLPVNSITADQVTDDILKQSHLIIVGKPPAFTAFTDLNFPIPQVGGLLSSPELQEGDGVLQIMASPWNSSRVIMMVGGNTDQAVVKAAQALSTSNLQTGNTPDYSIVAQVNPVPSTGITSTTAVSWTSPDMLFSDLGYSFVTTSGIGTHWMTYEFTIPPGQEPTDELYLDLKYSVSALVDSVRSEGVVYLNDVQIGSILLTSETTNLISARINLPLSALRSGINLLDVVFNLLPRDECSIFAFSGLWVTVYPDSILHIPLTPASDTTSSFSLQDLKSYPNPFANDPSLSTTSFILAQQDPYSWALAGKIAYDLGARVTGPVLGFRVIWDGPIPDEMKDMNFILIGEPMKLGILADLKASMPAYYDSGSNIAVLESQQIIYRISPIKSLGYLQLFLSSWNDQRAVLGIFGTNPDGLVFAVRSLLDGNTRDILAGNFATLDGTHAIVVDTRTGLGIGRIGPALGPAITQEEVPGPTELSPGAQVATRNSRQLIFAGILGILALIAVVILVAIRVRKKSL